jgi:acyl-coenzyme A thioesterase PaaI-like protein
MSSDADHVHHFDPELFGTEQLCYGCGPRHPNGFRLRFSRVGQEVHTRFMPGDLHQGPPALMHGGLILTLADELAAWTILGMLGKFGFTGRVEASLSRPVRINEEVTGVGKILRSTSRTVHVEVTLTQTGEAVFSGKFLFALLAANAFEKLTGRPLPEEWKQFTR